MVVFFRCVYVTKVFFCFIPCYLGLNWWSVFVLWHLLFFDVVGACFFFGVVGSFNLTFLCILIKLPNWLGSRWTMGSAFYVHSLCRLSVCILYGVINSFNFFFNAIIFGTEQMNWFVFKANEINRKLFYHYKPWIS